MKQEPNLPGSAESARARKLDPALAGRPKSASEGTAGARIGQPEGLAIRTDALPDALLVIDAQGRTRYVSPKAQAMFGAPAQDLVSRPFGIPFVLGSMTEVDVLRDNGESGIAEMRVSLAVWDDEPAYVAQLRDVTERVREADSLRRQVSLLRSLGEVTSLVVRADAETALFEGVCRVLVEVGRFKRSWLVMLHPDESQPARIAASWGFEPDQLDRLRSHVAGWDGDGAWPDCRPAFPSAGEAAVRRAVSDPGGPWDAEARELDHKSEITVAVRAAGRVVGALVVASSRSAAVSMQEFEVLTEVAGILGFGLEKRIPLPVRSESGIAATDLADALDVFARGMLPDVQDELSSILSHAERVRAMAIPGKTAGDSVSAIVAGASRAAGICHQVLVCVGAVPLARVGTHLNDLIARIVPELSQRTPANIAIRSDFAPNLPRVRADVSLLEFALRHLVGLAFDAMPDGGSVTVGTERVSPGTVGVDGDRESIRRESLRHSDYVCLTVGDSSNGVTQVVPSCYWASFSDPDAERATRPCTLGLAVAESVARRHGGFLAVQKTRFGGTLFRVFLPLGN